MNQAQTRFEVAIVGAGAVGATLAVALGRAGLSVAVIDARPVETRLAPDFDGRASAIAYANLRQWRALGMLEALRPQAQPIRRIEVGDAPSPGAGSRRTAAAWLGFDAEDLDPEGGDAATPEPLGWMVENPRMRAVLDGAVGAAGVAAFAPAELSAMSVEAGRVHLTLKDGRTLEASVLVGADGRDSGVRRTAGIGAVGWSYPQSGVVATVALEAPHEGVARQVFLPGGPLAVLPLTQDRASLVWSEAAARAQALVQAAPAAFEAYLARRLPTLGRARLVGPRFVHPLRLQLADDLVGRRTALVGDAAHVIHPVAGQGLNLGLKDAAALAEVLIEARRLGEDIGGAAVLQRYAAWRRFDSATLALATDLFARLFSNDQPILRVVRGAALAAVKAAPAARRLFAREAGGALGDLPRLLRGEAP